MNAVWQPKITDAPGALTPRPASGIGPLRILHCCGQFSTAGGGTERQARAVCGALAVRGHQVSVLSRKVPEAEPTVAGVAVQGRIRAIDRGRLFGITYLSSALLHLLREAGLVDLLHAYHLYLDAVAAVIAGHLRGRPVVAKMVGAGPGGDLDRLRQTAGGPLLLKLLRTLDVVIAPSSTCRAELLAAGFPAEQIRVIANAVDTSLFRPDTAVEPASALKTLDRPVIVYTGRLIEAKGLLDLLAAWRVLDTFDWYAPTYQSMHDPEEVRRWFQAAGLIDVRILEAPVAVRGRRPEAR